MSELTNRILELASDYNTDRAFLEACEIGNHSFLTDLRKGRNTNPGGDILAQIVRGTKCSGTWLLTGRGNKYHNDLSGKQVQEDETMKQVLLALERIEHRPKSVKELGLPPDLEIRLAQLLVKLLQYRSNDSHTPD